MGTLVLSGNKSINLYAKGKKLSWVPKTSFVKKTAKASFPAQILSTVSQSSCRLIGADSASCIGAKSYPVRITRARIQCRALGYKSPAIMQAEIAIRTDGAAPLSLRQINYTLDALHERQFFARARANERQTFYSNRMSQGELETQLITGKSYSADFHQRRRQHDAEFMARLKQSRRLLK